MYHGHPVAFPKKGYGRRFEKKAFSPSTNIYKDDKAVYLELALPGFKKEEINIDIKDQSLILSAKVESAESSDIKYSRKRFGKESFEVQFTMTDRIDQTNIQATMESGVLLVTLPYRPEVMPITKSISIQ